MPTMPAVLKVAVPAPVNQLFDYLPVAITTKNNPSPGMRVLVPFGKRRKVVGVIMEITKESNYPINKLKCIDSVLDTTPSLSNSQLELLCWASQYYHHAIGEVVNNALPVWLRKPNQPEKLQSIYWQLSDTVTVEKTELLKRSPRQLQTIQYLQRKATACEEQMLLAGLSINQRVLKQLVKKKLIEKVQPECLQTKNTGTSSRVNLNSGQQHAAKSIIDNLESTNVYLLYGLTGSGKTEVYMEVIQAALGKGRQSLILLPEINLTPQIIQRFQQRFQCRIAVQHSGLSDRERARFWFDAKTGQADIVLGTRSAVWTPLAQPGIFIVDEEHDVSYKQQDGFRYSAKDCLLMRAKKEKVPVVLGSATPSLESLHNIHKKMFHFLVLNSRAGKATIPDYELLDIRGKKMHGALSDPLVKQIKQHLQVNNQVLLFLNRRGYATSIYCHSCGWRSICERCERPFTYHKKQQKMCCHHCDIQRQLIEQCPECSGQIVLLGHGTERIEEQLQGLFPGRQILRIDRDSTRRKDAMSTYLDKIDNGEIDILVGTQMLAKGHHFPDVTLTAIVDADGGLFSTDFRASERLAQLFIQVSGRAGRSNKKGKVVVQTHYPEHPLFQELIQQGYLVYTETLLADRRSTSLPPFTYMAILHAEAHNRSDTMHFLDYAARKVKALTAGNLSIFGPIPSIMEKCSGRFRFQLVLQSKQRKHLHEQLDNWLAQLGDHTLSKKVRWSIDIDPQDIA